MANPAAPTESGGRRIPFDKDPAHAGTAYETGVRGAVTMSGETPVGHRTVLAPASTATRSSVAGAAADTSLLAANEKRVGFVVKNESAAILYLGYGSTAASVTNYTVDLQPGDVWVDPWNFAGPVRGFWATATGNARITELAHS